MDKAKQRIGARLAILWVAAFACVQALSLLCPVAATQAYAAAGQITFSNGGTATMLDNGAITGECTLNDVANIHPPLGPLVIVESFGPFLDHLVGYRPTISRSHLPHDYLLSLLRRNAGSALSYNSTS